MCSDWRWFTPDARGWLTRRGTSVIGWGAYLVSLVGPELVERGSGGDGEEAGRH